MRARRRIVSGAFGLGAALLLGALVLPTAAPGRVERAEAPVELLPMRPVLARGNLASELPKRDLMPEQRRPRWELVDFGEWDEDGDGALGWEEWKESMWDLRVFDQWDTNGDGLVEAAEFSNGLFDELDLDHDNGISYDEHAAGGAWWFSHTERYGPHGALDMNYDGMVDRVELDRGVVHGGMFADWNADADGLVNEVEFARALVRCWDRDGDGMLGLGELADVPRRRVDGGLAGVQPEP